MKSGDHGTYRRMLLRALTGAGAAALTGCDRVAKTGWGASMLQAGETMSQTVHKLWTPLRPMAQEFTEADLSPQFRSNGTSDPASPEYQLLARTGFAGWSLHVEGLVGQQQALTLAQLRAMPSRTQITRHDCVEGWSAIGKWTGVPLAAVLALARPSPRARYVMFHCADPMEADGTQPYYESIDLDDAYHPQTILAYELNGAALPVANGAPLRLRVERQLGYKHAKYLMRIELVERFDHLGRGRGGYWEDRGYQWYAGI